MTVISGRMQVKMPCDKTWRTYKKFESFEITKDISFGVKVEEDTPYLCIYR
jgi:uncharacterized protein YaiE (UPF0345 family)